jgi:basic membrane protein A and related proteins
LTVLGRRTAAVVGALCCTAAIAACGSSNSSSGGSAASSGSSTAAAGASGTSTGSASSGSSTGSSTGTSTSSGSGSSSSGKNFKVGLVTDIGGLNDHGFNHLAYEGLQRAEKQLGVQGTVLQSSSGADYIPNLTKLAQSGDNLVIAVGFLMAAPLEKVAQQYPKVHFAIIDSPGGTAPDTAKNIEGIDFAEQQAGYPAGYLAGLYMKKNNFSTASTVGGQSIPPVDLYIAGFQAGVQAADPSAKLVNAYSQNFTDESACKELALNQIQAGSKVVFQVAGGCGLGAISAGVASKIQVIGVDADQSYLSSQYVLTSAEKKVDVGVFTAAKDLMHGKFASNLQEDINNGGVGIGKIDAAGQPFEAQVNKVIAEMKSGKIKPPTVIKFK